MNKTIPSLLVVEDNDFDVKRLERGFTKLGQERPYQRARDGVEALEILRGEGGRTAMPTPCIILLDLNMPRMNGLEFLKALREDAEMQNMPVVVLTTSDYERDVKQAYDLYVSGYINKPQTSGEMSRVLRLLTDYWDECLYPN